MGQNKIHYKCQRKLKKTNQIYKNSKITKTSITNLQESIRQIFTSHSLRNIKMIQREHGTESDPL